MSGIPEWAKQRACDLAGYPWKPADVDFAGEQMCGHTALAEFARYISIHEQPPVDPIRKAMGKACGVQVSAGIVADFHVALAEHGLQIIPTDSTCPMDTPRKFHGY